MLLRSLCHCCCVIADVVREVGSITQLKAVFPKVFNKKVTWHAGDRLQELFAYEFRRMREALKAPGTVQKLYKNKVRQKKEGKLGLRGHVMCDARRSAPQVMEVARKCADASRMCCAWPVVLLLLPG